MFYRRAKQIAIKLNTQEIPKTIIVDPMPRSPLSIHQSSPAIHITIANIDNNNPMINKNLEHVHCLDVLQQHGVMSQQGFTNIIPTNIQTKDIIINAKHALAAL